MLDKRQSFSFVWGLNNDTPTALTSCTPVTLFVNRDDTQNSGPAAVPPYTMISYPEQGIPLVDSLGQGTTLSWTPRYAAGTKVILSLVDSAGNSGGVSLGSYTVGSGTSTACIPSPPSTSLSIDVAGTSTLNTCDMLPVHITGGQKPYVVSIAGTNEPYAFNTTMTGDNNYLQWVSVAAPQTTLLVAVSDSTGQYATTSSFITTAGSASTTCTGKQNIQSMSGSSTVSGGSGATTSSPNSSNTATTTSAPSSGGKSAPTGAIIGSIVGVLIVVGIIAYFYFRKKNQRAYEAGSRPVTGGFGLVDYKRGNPGAHDSFMPLRGSPNNSRVPLYGDQSPITATSALGGPALGSSALGGSTASNRQSGLDYYAHPPSDVSGTTSGWGTSMGHSHSLSSGTSIGLGVAAASVAGAPSAAQTKRQMVLEEQRRQQQIRANQLHPPPASVYPPASSYAAANPFGDNVYPIQPPSMQGAPPPNTQYGVPPSTIDRPYGSGTSPVAFTNPTGSGSGESPSISPAARAKASEAAQSRHGYDDDEDPIPYMQRQRTVLEVTNPDRNSQASGMSDPYGGMAPTVGVYQHEDAGVVVELPPAYREFSRTPAPPGDPHRNQQ